MSTLLEHPRIKGALERSGLFPASSDVVERILLACDHPEIDPERILEITKADWGTEEQSADGVLVVQTPQGLFLIVDVPRRFLRPAGHVRLRYLYEWQQDLIEDDELAPPGIFFVAKPGHVDFLLHFTNQDERDRMFRCIFEAHRGLFDRWET